MPGQPRTRAATGRQPDSAEHPLQERRPPGIPTCQIRDLRGKVARAQSVFAQNNRRTRSRIKTSRPAIAVSDSRRW
jgi:hypothetical protein